MSSESPPPPPDKSLSPKPPPPDADPNASSPPPSVDMLSDTNKQQQQHQHHQQFCLRWNNYQTNLMSVFDQLLQNESFVDVTLACDSQSIKAHKMVLSACSPYFQALFFDNPCQHPIIIMRDVKWEEMKSIVDFMYKGEINVSQEQIGPLLKIAEMLKIRGLAEVNNSETTIETEADDEPPVAIKKPRIDVVKWPSKSQSPSSSSHHRLISSTTPPVRPLSHPPLLTTQPPQLPPPSTLPPIAVPQPMDPMGLTALGLAPHIDEMEIKPGIAEMIREEERAKLLENSQAWMGTPATSIADSYQYQLQSMWQKCWNTNQNLMHHLRFRERGPLKSWRPETMADAIFSVLKEGLSLSQAARKYDIPYPTFVLYANRVHNMLGPSIDGGTDLRPKGRGRPQRILLGVWPDEHIKGVIKTVVFRDAKELGKEDNIIAYGRHSPIYPFPDANLPVYPGGACPNGIPQPSPTPSLGDTMSPEATAAAVAAVAHGLRQQMQMAAVAHHVDSPPNLFSLPHLQQKSPSQRSQPPVTTQPPSNLSSSRSQHTSPHDMRMQSPEDTPISSPIEMTLEPSVNLAVGVSGLPYGKPPEILFADDLSRNCTSSNTSSTSANSGNIKLEPIGDCRGD